MREHMTVAATLPEDGAAGALAGRIWRPDVHGPAIISVREDGLYDITQYAPTLSALADADNILSITQYSKAERVGELADILANTPAADRDPLQPWLLSPIDLQAVKAADATFAGPILEQTIIKLSETAPDKAEALQTQINALFGEKLRDVVPGSPEAQSLKSTLIEQAAWSPELEVCIGEDAQIFTKAQPMATVGHGMEADLDPRSAWNHSEPEVVLIISSAGQIVGVTLGNDVSLRDFTDRSALLLSQAKESRASAAIGPFVRFFDNFFSLETVQRMNVKLNIKGQDRFELETSFSMSQMTRDPKTLVANIMEKTYPYPDGVAFYLGTGFIPTEDRGEDGAGFTHRPGDITIVSTPALGSLANIITVSDQAEPWTFGAGALMHNLSGRGLLKPTQRDK